MIAALVKEVPVLLVGWSHKYEEVLEQFSLGEYATDFSGLSSERLLKDFDHVLEGESMIREKLQLHKNKVMESSEKGMEKIMNILDNVLKKKQTEKKVKKRNFLKAICF